LISRRNRALPVMLVRSPTLTNSESSVMLSGSSPERRRAGAISVGTCGALPSTALLNMAMWSGVVPQQPPTMLTSPLPANSSMIVDIWSGVSSYSPNALGSPALG
jgi:hypothetical protein